MAGEKMDDFDLHQMEQKVKEGKGGPEKDLWGFKGFCVCIIFMNGYKDIKCPKSDFPLLHQSIHIPHMYCKFWN